MAHCQAQPHETAPGGAQSFTGGCVPSRLLRRADTRGVGGRAECRLPVDCSVPKASDAKPLRGRCGRWCTPRFGPRGPAFPRGMTQPPMPWGSSGAVSRVGGTGSTADSPFICIVPVPPACGTKPIADVGRQRFGARQRGNVRHGPSGSTPKQSHAEGPVPLQGVTAAPGMRCLGPSSDRSEGFAPAFAGTYDTGLSEPSRRDAAHTEGPVPSQGRQRPPGGSSAVPGAVVRGFQRRGRSASTRSRHPSTR